MQLAAAIARVRAAAARLEAIGRVQGVRSPKARRRIEEGMLDAQAMPLVAAAADDQGVR